MATLPQRAEILKFARLLGVAPAQVPYLEKLDAATIRALRERSAASLFDADLKLFQKIAAASRQLPAHLCARLAERAFGPLLVAKLTGLVPPDRAVEVARLLHTNYLTEVCIQLDPRTARAVLAAMPVGRIVEVARELARREEFITMGRFVDNLTDDAVHATVAALSDEALLHIAFFVEDEARLGDVFGLLPDHRLRGMIEVAAEAGADLWPEALALIGRVDEDARRRMAELAAELEEAAIAKMIAVTHEQSLWAELLPLLAQMPADSQRRLVNLSAARDEGVLTALIHAAHTADLRDALAQLVEHLDEAGRTRAHGIAERHHPVVAERLRSAWGSSAEGAARKSRPDKKHKNPTT